MSDDLKERVEQHLRMPIGDLVRDLWLELEQVRADKAIFEQWYAAAIKEVTRLRDELDLVSK